MNKKSQINIEIIIAFVLMMIGFIAIMFMGLGLMFNNPTIMWAGTIVLGILSVLSALVEKVFLK